MEREDHDAAESGNNAVMLDEILKKNSLVSSISDLQTASSVGDPKVESRVDLNKAKPMNLWNMIYQHMAEGSNGENPEIQGDPAPSVELPESDFGTDYESEARDLEVKKLGAVKLVKEAIEKILLPEIQDVTSNHPKEAEIVKVKNEESDLAKTSEKSAPKNWSNLKKWIILQRFTRELEKVRKFNVKSSKSNHESESEKIVLKHKTDGKKNAEEWMLDYALRQAVNQLAPTQKRKVALLVKAFEMVVPPTSNDKAELDDHSTRSEEIVAISESSSLELDETKQGNVRQTVENAVADPEISESSSVELDETKQGNVRQTVEDAVADTVNVEPVLTTQISSRSLEDAVENRGEAETFDNHIEMWHTIYQHVVSSLAEKIGSKLLDVEESEDESKSRYSDLSKLRGGLTKSAVVHLIKETVDEILLSRNDSENATMVEQPKSNNWSKLKKLLLVRRSIKALKAAKKNETKKQRLLNDREPEKIELRRQMMDERKKAEEWMLDYAVQHIVNKLTPARKQRVSLLVEAFEAVVPFPGM